VREFSKTTQDSSNAGDCESRVTQRVTRYPSLPRRTGFLAQILMKILIILLLAAIIVSLALALRYLYKDRDNAESNRTVRALTARISLSLGLFFLLILLYKAGLLHPHGLRPDYPVASAQQTKP
jgi:hypothetical protein